MNIVNYLKLINKESQKIFEQTIEDSEKFGEAHYLSACIFEFSNYVQDKYEKEMLATVSAQLESGSINLALGLYRQAFSSLRLAFEMGLGVSYFSIHKMEHFEWLNGIADIKWSKLIDKENGVLSTRFSNAFFSELTDQVETFNESAALIYRALSEFVHGNNETWIKSGIIIKINSELVSQYFKYLKSVINIILFSLCCRYLKSLTEEQLEAIDFIPDELRHINAIREIFGGPKQI